MAHLLSTINPQAAEEADSGWKPAGPVLVEGGESGTATIAQSDLPSIDSHPTVAIPGIGNTVVYHLRTGDSRNMRVKFPAIVMDGDPETGRLKLWVIVDDGDTWMQDHVPAHVAPEPGWEAVRPFYSNGAVTLGPASITTHPGLPEPSSAFIEMTKLITKLRIEMAELTGRVEAVEGHPAMEVPPLEQFSAVAPVKRGPGRPPKPKG